MYSRISCSYSFFTKGVKSLASFCQQERKSTFVIFESFIDVGIIRLLFSISKDSANRGQIKKNRFLFSWAANYCQLPKENSFLKYWYERCPFASCLIYLLIYCLEIIGTVFDSFLIITLSDTICSVCILASMEVPMIPSVQRPTSNKTKNSNRNYDLVLFGFA